MGWHIDISPVVSPICTKLRGWVVSIGRGVVVGDMDRGQKWWCIGGVGI